MPTCDSPRVYYPLSPDFMRLCRSAPHLYPPRLRAALAGHAYDFIPASMNGATWVEVCADGYVHGYHGPRAPSDDAKMDIAFAMDIAYDLDY